MSLTISPAEQVFSNDYLKKLILAHRFPWTGDRACRTGNWFVLKEFQRLQGFTKWAMDGCAIRGDIEMLEYLHPFNAQFLGVERFALRATPKTAQESSTGLLGCFRG